MTEHVDVHSWAPEYDAVAAAPDSHKVLDDRPDFRVLEVTIAPGHIEPAHHHIAKRSIMAVFSAPEIRVHDLAGGQVINVPAREASDSEPIVQYIPAEPMHQIENLHPDQEYRAVRLEYK